MTHRQMAERFKVDSRTIARALNKIAPGRERKDGHWTQAMKDRVDLLLADGLPASWIREDVPGTTISGIRGRRRSGGYGNDSSLSGVLSSINMNIRLRPLHEAIAPR